ncbi:hypothetical protein [Nonomuraea jabiensis]|uniref:hypothetical protein n=1 Tax=Nonomuraea jabiensis TaxID=882448 RepID=UPI0036CA08DC
MPASLYREHWLALVRVCVLNASRSVLRRRGVAARAPLGGSSEPVGQAVPGGQRSVTLYDLATGRAGLLFQIQMGIKLTPTPHLQDGIAWFQKGRSIQVVVNLAAIGR